jgi:hypothetical protein
MDDALRTLNDLIDAWHLERLMIYAVEPSVHTLTGATVYTLGPPDGTLGTVRPQRIEGAGLIYPSSNIESPLPLLTLDEYRTHHAGIYIDGGYPKANVHVNPLTAVGHLVLYGWVPFTQFATVDSTVDLPPGYARALRWNLALELAPMARIAVKIPDVLYANIQQQAIESKAWVKSFNSQSTLEEMQGDPALGCNCGSGYNIYTDH